MATGFNAEVTVTSCHIHYVTEASGFSLEVIVATVIIVEVTEAPSVTLGITETYGVFV